VSDIDTVVVVESLNALDPEWPIREATRVATQSLPSQDLPCRLCEIFEERI